MSPVASLLRRSVTLCCALVAAGTVAAAQIQREGRVARAFFYSEGQRVQITIALDSIALIFTDTLPLGRVRDVAGQAAMQVGRVLPDGIVILSTRDTLDRAGVRQRARAVRDAVGQGARAALVLRASPTGAPFFLTDEFIVQFNPDVSRTAIDALNAQNGVGIVTANRYVLNQFVLRVPVTSQTDALEMANRYEEHALTRYAHPNFVTIVELRGGPPDATRRAVQPVIPNDPLFPNQWHLNNTGQSGGTVDADIDAPEAWDITLGIAAVRIGVVDGGFNSAHPDLLPNRWTNPGEIPGNGIDDDVNGLIDDVNGWDFTPCDAAPVAGCGDNNPTGGNHGTSVAGSAAARGNNALGVSGSCPNCTWIPLRNGNTAFAQATAFAYAQQLGVEVITNSWGYAVGTPIPPAVSNAVNNAVGAGAVILWAMNNGNINDCGATPDISSLPSVIAVSAVSNQDRKVTESAFGNCMDVLSPTHRGYGPNPNGSPAGSGSAFTGTLNVATTDIAGVGGYNNTSPQNAATGFDPTFCPAETADRDYTLCFGGTSAATPVAAGVVGLIRSAAPGLTPLQVQRLLQDAADKIENSTASYGDNTGFSTPAGGNATHGWGRVNAFEAVRIAAPAAAGGKAGVDIFLRDNRLDWGNTQQPSNVLFEPVRGFIGHWRSQDIKVDAPPYETPPTAATFDAFVDQTPSAAPGNVNRVYVRVRNRGPTMAGAVTVKLHWTQFGTALPPLPADFWTAFPGNSTDPTNEWTPLQCSTGGFTCTVTNLAYSGASVATTAGDVAQIVQFDFPAPPIDPSRPNHFCLVGMIDSPSDRILPLSRATQPSDFVVDWLTPHDNNTTHRNYQDLSTARSSRFFERFYVRNPFPYAIRAQLLVDAPPEWIVKFDNVVAGQAFALAPKQRMLVGADVQAPGPRANADVSIVQQRVDATPAEVIGGLTLQFRATAPEPQPPPGGKGFRRALSLHAGVAVPLGSSANVLDPGPTANVDVIFPLTPRLAVDLRGGVAQLKGSSGTGDVDVWDVSANLKWMAIVSTPWVFVNGGVGVYRVGSADWVAGANIGAGVGRSITPTLDAEVTVNYHRAFSPGPDVPYAKLQAGLIWSP